jgi:hypothetical protein
VLIFQRAERWRMYRNVMTKSPRSNPAKAGDAQENCPG